MREPTTCAVKKAYQKRHAYQVESPHYFLSPVTAYLSQSVLQNMPTPRLVPGTSVPAKSPAGSQFQSHLRTAALSDFAQGFDRLLHARAGLEAYTMLLNFNCNTKCPRYYSRTRPFIRPCIKKHTSPGRLRSKRPYPVGDLAPIAPRLVALLLERRPKVFRTDGGPTMNVLIHIRAVLMLILFLPYSLRPSLR